MLVLPTLHTYLTQLLTPPSIHTALLLTPEGALVSYASQSTAEDVSASTVTHGSQGSPSSSMIAGPGGMPSSLGSVESHGSSASSTPQDSKPGSVTSVETQTAHQRSKDEIRMAAGLAAEVWAETREDGEGMVESELGRMLVLAVDDEREFRKGTEPLLLLAVNGTSEADWDAMQVKACKLATFLAPSVNKHRGMMGTTGTAVTSSVNGSKSRTRSTATSPGRGFNR